MTCLISIMVICYSSVVSMAQLNLPGASPDQELKQLLLRISTGPYQRSEVPLRTLK